MAPTEELDAPRVRAWSRPLPVRLDRLTPLERAALEAAPFDEPRRREWIRGRLAAHRLLPAGASVLGAADGAPRVVGARGYRVSLSHQGPALAVAVRRAGPIAVDLVARGDAPRLARALARLAPVGDALADPVRGWAALECALKLRRRGIVDAFAAALGLWQRGAEVGVTGIGAEVFVRFPDVSRRLPGWCLGVAW